MTTAPRKKALMDTLLPIALFVSLDLGSSRWKLAFSDGRRKKPRYRDVDALDLDAFFNELERARVSLDLPADARVFSCFEAGRDGFWLHRVLVERGIENVVIDPGSLRVRSRKSAKTDRIDAGLMVRELIRIHRGEHATCSIVEVPPEEVEDLRRLGRERARLVKERGSLRSKIASLFATRGLRFKEIPHDLETLHDATDQLLRPHTKAELRRLGRRLELVEEQIREVDRERESAVVDPDEPVGVRQVAQCLVALCGVGSLSSFELAVEALGWRQFRNTREVSAASGLAPIPHMSDGTQFDRGISKASRPRLRSLMVQLAWLWIRYQPDSQLTQWFQVRYGAGGKRSKRCGIVALARKLFVLFWKIGQGQPIPDDLRLKSPKPAPMAA